jgi:hypothetical protein
MFGTREFSVAGSLAWAFYVVLCAVIWPAMLVVMYSVAFTVLSAEARAQEVRRSDKRPRFSARTAERK